MLDWGPEIKLKVWMSDPVETRKRPNAPQYLRHVLKLSKNVQYCCCVFVYLFIRQGLIWPFCCCIWWMFALCGESSAFLSRLPLLKIWKLFSTLLHAVKVSLYQWSFLQLPPTPFMYVWAISWVFWSQSTILLICKLIIWGIWFVNAA